MSIQPASATQVKPSIAKHIANPATVRRQMIETAAYDLHRAASFHARIRLGRAADCEQQSLAGAREEEIVGSLRHLRRKNGCRAFRAVFESRPLPWYIPQLAILRVLRGFGVAA
jgi:hypothetical protein